MNSFVDIKSMCIHIHLNENNKLVILDREKKTLPAILWLFIDKLLKKP